MPEDLGFFELTAVKPPVQFLYSRVVLPLQLLNYMDEKRPPKGSPGLKIEPARSKADRWCDIDHKHSLTGALPSSQDTDAEAYLSQFSDFDARKAEGLGLAYPIEPLVNIRSLLYRGRLDEAATQMDAISIEQDALLKIELLHERARTAYFEGDLSLGLHLVEEALSAQPTPVTRLALLQMKALAFYERQDYSLALTIVQQAESLCHIFPFSTSTFYVAALRCKLQARMQGPEIAKTNLRKTFGDIASARKLDAEILSVYVRAEMDLRRLEGAPVSPWALASFALENAMGEDLYAGLALLEIVTSENAQLAESFVKTFEDFRNRFQKIQGLWAEIQNEPGRVKSATALAIDEHRKVMTRSTQELPTNITQVYVEPLNVFITLKDLSVGPLLLSNQDIVPQVFRSLANGSISKPEFFAGIWGSQKYSSVLHDGLIRSAVFRAKKRTGADLRMKNGTLLAPHLLVIKNDC